MKYRVDFKPFKGANFGSGIIVYAFSEKTAKKGRLKKQEITHIFHIGKAEQWMLRSYAIRRDSRKRGIIMSGLLKRLKEERIQGSSAVLNYSNFDYWVNWDDIVDIVEDYDQPQLNPNQQIVLEWLKEEQTKNPELTIFGTLSVLFDESENRFMNLDVIDALNDLSNSQQAGVFQAFSQWALEQEEE